jgi:MFS family permease
VLLGGVLTTGLGWRWVLFVNTPIGITAALLAPRLIAESRAQGERRRFDIVGAITVTAGLSVLAYALVDAQKAQWGSFQTIGLIGLAIALLAVFVVVELRSKAPLMPFRIFRLPTVTGANVSGLLVGAALFSMFFFISLYMQQVLGYSAIHAGVSYVPLAVSIILAAGIASSLVTKVGFKPVLLAGLGFTAAGLVWFAQVRTHGSFPVDILGPSLLAGIGLGLSFVPMTLAAVAGVRDRDAGLASGLINTSQQIGGALGLAILATIANSRTTNLLSSGHGPLKHALTQGFHAAFLTGAGFAVLGFLLCLALIRSRDSRAHVEAAAVQPA